MCGELDLGQGDHEILRQLAAGFLDQRGDENVQCADRAVPQIFIKRLDPDPDERRQSPRRHSRRDLPCALLGVSVLFAVHAVSITILIVQAEILHRLALQFFHDSCVEFFGESRLPILSQNPRELRRIRRVIPQRAQRDFTEFAGRVRFEKMRAAVNRVHRLPPVGFSRIGGHERAVFRSEGRHDGREIFRGQGGVAHDES